MARDVGNFQETKSVINMIESREMGHDTGHPKANLDTPYKGGKVSPSGKDFAKPSGHYRKHLE